MFELHARITKAANNFVLTDDDSLSDVSVILGSDSFDASGEGSSDYGTNEGSGKFLFTSGVI